LITNRYSYDTASRLQTVSNLTSGASHSAHYSYLANSPLVSQIQFKRNGTEKMTTSKQYDFLNRLTVIQSSGAGVSPASSFDYAYNQANQRIRSKLVDGSYWNYEYDALGQVTTAKRYWSDQSPVAGQHSEYAFDDIGNRLKAASGGNENGWNLRTNVYSANALNQNTSILTPGYESIFGVAMATNAVTVNSGATSRKELNSTSQPSHAWCQ
jgi:YD repeat-containing protein